MNPLRWIGQAWDWSMAAKWRTWLMHFLLAALLSVAFSPWAVATFYVLREVEQNALKLRETGDFDGEDAVLDALSGILGAVAVALTGWMA